MKFYNMKTTTILLCSALSLALAKPNGLYHQEYNFKSSSSSYKNNELQHKNDDSGFYSKDGDLEGRIKPKVNAHNEHSEYVNPNSQTHSHTGVNFGENGEMNSYGRMNAQNQDLYGQNLMVEGLNGQSGYHGSSGYGGYGSSSSHSNYGSQSSYGSSMSSSLQSLTARLQAQLEKQLQDAIYENQRSSSYSMHSSQSLQNLEEELRRNLTDNLDQEIRNQYGSQSIKGGYTYSIAGGKVQPTANYRNQDLEDWRRQAERNLISKLQNSYRQSSSSSSSSSNNNYYQPNNYQQSTPRIYSTLYPNIHTTTYRPYNYQTTTTSYYTQHNEQSQQIRYTPISNPAPLSTIAHNVQGELNEQINEILENVQRKYFTLTSFSLTNFDVVLNRLENELRSNVTYLLDEQLRRNYGNQNLRDGYMFSVGPNGQHSSQHNYSQRDYETLREQVEKNLLQRLKSEFESRKSRYQQNYQSSSNSYGSSSYGSYGSYGQNEYTSMRPSATNMGSLITAGQRGVKGGNNDYRYVQGSRQSGYETSGGVSETDLALLQRQLQEKLSRNLQQAISKSQYSSGYSSGSRSNNQQAFQLSLQQLSEELNRNLTRQLDEARSGYGSTYSTYGSGVSESQLAGLRSQLQSDLLRQLQQGLTQSWSSSSSYSASASSSNYRPVRGFGSSGQYVNTMDGEDCQHDDPNAYHSHRQRRHSGYRRSYGQYQQQVGQEIEDIGQVIEHDDFASLRTDQRGGNQYQVEDVGQVEEDFGKLQVDSQTQGNTFVGQVVKDDFNSVNTTNQRRRSQPLGHQVGSQYQSNKYVGQQQEVDDIGKFKIGSQSQSNKLVQGSESQTNTNVGQQQEDLGQVVEEDSFEKIQVGNQPSSSYSNIHMGQHVGQNNRYMLPSTTQNTVDLGQQIEGDDFGNFQIGSQSQNNKLVQGSEFPTNSNVRQQQEDLGQVVEEDSFEKIQVGSQPSRSYSNIHMGQHVGQNNRYMRPSTTQNTVDLGQQIEDDEFGNFQIGSQSQNNKLVQGSEFPTNSNVRQQQEDSGQVVEEDSFDKIQVGVQQSSSHGNIHLGQQHVGQNYRYRYRSTTQKTVDLGQQIEGDDEFGRLQVESNRQTTQKSTGLEQVNLGQEIEGKLQVSSQPNNKPQIGQTPVVGHKIEDNDDYGQIQVESQQTANHQITSLLSPSSTNHQNKFYNNVQYSNINQQTEDDALRGFSQTKPTPKPQNNQLLGLSNSQSIRISTSRSIPQVNDLIQQVEESDFEETSNNIRLESSTQSTTGSASSTLASLKTSSESSGQSMVEAEAEAERLIAAIRASQRKNNQFNRQYSDSGVYNSYRRNYNYDSASSVTDNINRGDIQPVLFSTSNTKQPENERIYESSTKLNLRPQNSYGSFGSMNSQSYGSSNSYLSHSRTNDEYTNMESHSTPSPMEQNYSYKPYRPTSYNSQTSNSHNKQLNYGFQHQINDEIVTYTGRDIEPLEPRHAKIVEPVAPTQGVYVYKSQVGVKGGRRAELLSPSVTPIEAVEIVSTTPGVPTTTEELPWWKRFGNKVKDGAKNLKDKIVG
ncbi:unnamed protein product [Brassicogethes aeneus]|uniref:Uncharacterized protein n=1 Tax=Brassicogethes aeneus TaxID=1431903 RepID=A0A9P0FFJ9_BRAAE|nr:unnamed protein product [Brassicogethes aeneus]